MPSALIYIASLMVLPDKIREAVKSRDLKTLKTLLENGFDLNHDFKKGWTALHWASRDGSHDVAYMLLEHGANVNAENDLRRTPLDEALKNGRANLANLLRKRGGQRGCERSLHAAVNSGELKWVKKQVAAGVDIDQLADGERPLCLAFARGHWHIAKFLLTKGCDVTKPQQWDATPLHFAAAAGAPDELLAKLLKRGAKIDARDNCERTPLCLAAGKGDEATVDWLLDHGADLTRGQEDYSTPVYCALHGGHVELASHLIDRGGKSTLHQAVQCNHLARARQKLNAGADVNHEQDPHRSELPLEMAIWLDSTDMVALLLEFGADPNQQDRYAGDTSLHQAVRKGSAKMVKLLLAHGANPEITNSESLTPIEFARRKDRLHLASLMEAHLDKQLSLGAAQTGIEPLYTVRKVAELLSVDDTFILELIKARKITGLYLDQETLRITAGSVQRYIARLASLSNKPSRML